MFKVTYVSGNNKKAGDAGDSKSPYYYVKIKFDEKKARKAGLSKAEINELKALLKSMNQNLKEQKCYYTIELVDPKTKTVRITGKGNFDGVKEAVMK